MSPQSVLQIVSLIVLPTILALWLCVPAARSRLELSAKLAAVGVAFLLLVLIGAWQWVGYGFRFYLPAIYAVSSSLAMMRGRRLPFVVKAHWRQPVVFGCVLAMLPVLAGIFLAFAGRASGDGAIELEFPVHGGVYQVGEAGSTRVINHHIPKGSQKYALDINKLNGLGMRGSLWDTEELGGYEIFGEPVYSPCDGRVAVARDNSPDRLYGEAAREGETAGNFVVIECSGVNVWLAHMMRGSILVRRGAQVVSGEAIGRVGSSGESEAPHLHIHAEGRAGVPVPILFEGKFLVRNAIVRADD